jgi:hypothetical protein
LEEKGKGETEIRRLISVHQQEILSVKVRCWPFVASLSTQHFIGNVIVRA